MIERRALVDRRQGMKDKRIALRLTADERHRLDTIARNAGLTPSEAIRRILATVTAIEPGRVLTK